MARPQELRARRTAWDWESLSDTQILLLEQIQAKADRLQGLLIELEVELYECPICKGELRKTKPLLPYIPGGHADDCRLAKELADDN